MTQLFVHPLHKPAKAAAVNAVKVKVSVAYRVSTVL